MSPAALDVIECLPTMDELDSEPSVEDLRKAIDSLASGKAPGNDGIPPELIKHQCLSQELKKVRHMSHQAEKGETQYHKAETHVSPS